MHALDLFDAPAPAHAEAGDTERAAAETVEETVASLRLRVLEALDRAGTMGLTGWEAAELLGMTDRETSIRPRLTELQREAFDSVVRKTRWRRRNRKGNSETVYVLASHWDDALHAKRHPIGGADR